MDYSEAEDLNGHQVDVGRMHEALAAAGGSIGGGDLVLDIGGGAGMHSAFIAASAGRVICTDFSDQNARFGGQFIKLLSEKFLRNGHDFPIDKLEFHAVDATSLIYRDGLFDLVVSFNAFEHIPDPALALAEMLRVVKPGGLVYLSFDPIWTCDSGSHFQHRVAGPWQHLLSSDDDYAQAMREAGADAFEVAEYRQAMNRKSLAYYREVFDAARPCADFLVEYQWSGCTAPENATHPNFALCRQAGYSEEELLARGMAKVLRKR